MELWIATSNQGKLNEFKMLFNSLVSRGLKIHSQTEMPVFSQPPENGETFVANARIKARALKSVKSGVWVIGEDSGLQVEGLNNLPGVHSARYAGPHASDGENVAKLLKMLAIRHIANRNAKFVSTIVAFSPTGEEFVFEGEMSGTISTSQKGTTGFGYDPVFVPTGETKTLAEIGSAAKNKISHRAAVCTKLIEKIGTGL